ncbi:MAG TPA: 2-oxoacid:acceptor oxidoreductase family protein [Thermoanaerobaculia bacterium]|nr:2-oxoacid:acceptor oxidoreductase family protein [Thermoanaerobaculia bacterium]
MSVFYDQFERHNHGEGLKGRSTHYCAGCGHGLIHKYLAESIDELGLQDRTVAVSPVGCAVFMYYYLDVGNSQAAHGRASVVAVAHKLANPDAVVVSYQGDGDLAAIGLAEIFSVAQLAVPISVVFVNNAIYGMTGGQMAPTTLPGQQTATSPTGRGPLEGQPLRMAELMAQLDGPIYVERVALYDPKQRTRAKKAIKKALQLQVENRGFSFVEVLSECPTHLGMTPEEAETWVKERMTEYFPLGVKKDLAVEPRPPLPAPLFAAEDLLAAIGSTDQPPPRFASAFPAHLDPSDLGIKFAGAGGDGAQTAAMLVTHAAIHEGYDATHIPSYGPESRGGTSYADVRIAAREVLSPAAPRPKVLVAFNSQSVDKFAPLVPAGGIVLYDSAMVETLPEMAEGVRAIGVPFSTLASELGRPLIKNVVALGAFQAATGVFPEESLLEAMRETLAKRPELLPLNEQAFRKGIEAVAA